MSRTIYRKLIASMFVSVTYVYNRWQPGIRILMYHRVTESKYFDQLSVSPSRFESHIEYLSKHYRVISLSSAIKELSASSKLQAGVVVTFDDGYLDNLTNAIPVLLKYKVPATIFITTRFCDQSIRHPRYANNSGERLHLTWDEVAKLLKVPGISIGSHTLTHPYLSQMSKEQSLEEIVESRRIIQTKIGLIPQYFCYPSGDYGDRELINLSIAGYSAAVTVAPGANRLATPLLELRRTEINDKDDIQTLRLKLCGAFDPVHWFLHWRRKRNRISLNTNNPIRT